MTRLVHLTDLHFGLHRADLVEPLRAAIHQAAPDMVVASGDLTQRARPGQFAQALAFLRGLDRPFLVTPGNHDLPVLNPLMRLLDPFGPFRRNITRHLPPPDLAPPDLTPPDLTRSAQIGRLRLFTVNTANPWLWRGGIARMPQIDAVCAALRDGPTDVTNIVACHHPLQEPPGFERGETRGGGLALDRLARAGCHVVLSGHLHHWTTGLGIDARTSRPIFQMQTGTALCARDRERLHGFAALQFGPNRLSVTRWIIDEPARRFVPEPAMDFAVQHGQWTPAR